ncbi:hypothetical protein RJ639_043660 [Escallonia herrerae]|uniref:Beta-1,3-glucanase n=1 Tax=Escallonia herrerae TaxID=1293975 RepID=A0AA88WIQ5_9ASTE|nr:hypothetical protein RJ639_043660 [Escallonia herrerae]
MQNIYHAIVAAGLQNQIKVSTATYTGLLQDSFPPSGASFRPRNFITPIVEFLARNNLPMFVNIVVSESEWPSAGLDVATTDNAQTYYRNLISHVTGGTGSQGGREGISKRAQSIGVCLGGYGDNIPPVNETVNLYQSNNIRKMRIYDPDPTATLQALRGSKLELMLGVANENLQSLASSSTTATEWVQRNARDYLPDVKIRYIAVGNEVQPSDERLRFVLPAMQNIYNAISLAGLQNEIKVSTVIDLRLLGNYDRPSQASFSEAAMPNIQPIITFLVNIKSPLLANVYPYFTYIYNTETIQLPYALFTAPGVVVPDGELGYQNLFDALLDALYSAVEKVGGQSLEIVVAESGWPSDRGTYATVDSASTYYRNLINHVPRGTPKRSGRGIETYLFAMYDENLKPGDETERHFGLFYPDKQPKYQITFG